jgi:signal transduction histidine kinase
MPGAAGQHVLLKHSMACWREAISNAIVHGGTRTVTIDLHRGRCRFLGRGRSQPHCLHSEHDLLSVARARNMRARANTAGGTLRIHSAPGQGARVALVLPVFAT